MFKKLTNKFRRYRDILFAKNPGLPVAKVDKDNKIIVNTEGWIWETVDSRKEKSGALMWIDPRNPCKVLCPKTFEVVQSWGVCNVSVGKVDGYELPPIVILMDSMI